MKLIDMLLITAVIALTNVAVITFCVLAWSMFEGTKLGETVSEWIIKIVKGEKQDETD